MNTSSKRQANRDGHAQGRHAVVLGGSHPRISLRVLLHILKASLRATSVSSVSLWWPLRSALTTETQRTQR
jgi:hypothetical protein